MCTCLCTCLCTCVFTCSPVHLFTCSPVHLFTCSPVHVISLFPTIPRPLPPFPHSPPPGTASVDAVVHVARSGSAGVWKSRNQFGRFKTPHGVPRVFGRAGRDDQTFLDRHGRMGAQRTVREVFMTLMVHVRCVTSSTDHIMKRQDLV